MADEKKTEPPSEENPFEPVTLGAGIPWLPGRGNTLRSGGDKAGEPEKENAEQTSDADES